MNFAQQSLTIARKLRQPELEAVALSFIGWGYMKMNEFEKSLDSYFQSRRCYQETEDWEGQGDVNQSIGHILQFAYSDYSTALRFYEEARRIYEEHRVNHRLVSVLNNISVVYYKQGKHVDAVEYLLQALHYSEKYGRLVEQANLMANLAEEYALLKDDEHFQEYLNRALILFEKENYVNGMGRAHFDYGKWYQENRKYGQAELHLLKALDLFQRYQNMNRITSAWHQLGLLYSERDQWEKAQDYFSKALAARRETHDELGVVQTFLAMGALAQKKGNPADTMRCLQESLKLSLDKGYANELKEVYSSFFLFYSRLGDTAKALFYKKLAEETEEKVSGSRVTGKVMSLLMKYEENRINRRLSRSKIRLGVIITSAALFLILSTSLLFVSSRRRAHLRIQFAQSQILLLEQALDRLQKQIQEMKESPEPDKYKKSGLTLANAQKLLQGFLQLMGKEKLFLDCELKQQTICERLQTNTTYLSQVINEHLKTSYNDFINRLRIEEAKRLLIEPRKVKLSIIDVAFESGFNSKDTFNRSFRRFTGMNPKQFRRKSALKETEG